MRKRTLGRELALQILYQLDLRGQEVMDDLEACLREAPEPPDEEVMRFARELVSGYWERRPAVDEKIEAAAKNWQLRRMAVIDRNILRLATYELLFRDDIPPLVSINEAIDLAKKFSTPQSGRFVNGILDNIRLTWAPPEKRVGSRVQKPVEPGDPDASPPAPEGPEPP
ncbi:MAG: transcription antitermination factor NusB [Planctomycetes bacterium]|nr:transcription antitermination factor NusB [Planctomycetota bacterium]